VLGAWLFFRAVLLGVWFGSLFLLRAVCDFFER
jgi:hypothetical protein